MQDTPNVHLAPQGAYNPYTGAEALKILFNRIWEQCKAHQDFANHLAYTKFEWDFELKFKGGSIEPTIIKGKDRAEIRIRESTITVTGTSAPAPDDGRREAGLVIPGPKMTKQGLVDLILEEQEVQS